MSYFEVKCAYTDCKKIFKLSNDDYEIYAVIGSHPEFPSEKLKRLKEHGRKIFDKLRRKFDNSGLLSTDAKYISEDINKYEAISKLLFKCPHCKCDLTITVGKYKKYIELKDYKADSND